MNIWKNVPDKIETSDKAAASGTNEKLRPRRRCWTIYRLCSKKKSSASNFEISLLNPLNSMDYARPTRFGGNEGNNRKGYLLVNTSHR